MKKAGAGVMAFNRIEREIRQEGMLNGMGQLLEKFGNDMYIERLIQKAVEHLSNGKSEVLIQEFLGLNDEEMERAKELYERTKKRQ